MEQITASSTKTTVVLGASPNPERYSNIAVKRLIGKRLNVVPIGNKTGTIIDKDIVQGTPPIEEVDTVTLYLRPELQERYYDYIFSLNPRRIIMNPGTENLELLEKAKERGIEVEFACTLVLLTTDTY